MTPRGGKRPGAGRKPLPVGEKGKRGKGVQIWLPPELADWSAAFAESRGLSRSKLIAEALEAIRTPPTAEPPAAGDARDAAAYLSLVADLAAVEVPAGFMSAYKLPDDLARQVAELYGLPAGKTPELLAALSRVVAIGLVAARHLATVGADAR